MWFINEDEDVYEYDDLQKQALLFPGDDHIGYPTEAAARDAVEARHRSVTVTITALPASWGAVEVRSALREYVAEYVSSGQDADRITVEESVNLRDVWKDGYSAGEGDNEGFRHGYSETTPCPYPEVE